MSSTPNPYESSSEASWSQNANVPTKKPASITVFGILNLVFGAMGIFGLLASAAIFFVMPRDPAMPNPTLDLLDQGGPYALFTYGSMIAGIPITIILIAAGFGLLLSKSYGRTLSIVYAIYTIVMGVIGLVVNFVFVLQPMMEQLGGNGGPQQPAATAGIIGGIVGGIIGGVIGLMFPVLLLYFMTRQNVKDYLAGGVRKVAG